MTRSTIHENLDELAVILGRVCQRIAPVWPLDRFVAVNPYLGMLERDFRDVAQHLRGVAGAEMTPPASWYLQALDEGRFSQADLAVAIEELELDTTVPELLTSARTEREPARPEVRTVADVLDEATDERWARVATEAVSGWAAAFFDEGQATWRPVGEEGPFTNWRAEATLDRTPEVLGVRGFRATVASLPAEPLQAAGIALERLGVPREGLESYLHRLLLRVGGWSAYAARIVWDAKLYQERDDDTLLQFSCILLVWELALFQAFEDRIASDWETARRALVDGPGVDPGLDRRLALQRAFERATQKGLVAEINACSSEGARSESERPVAQAVFCIDVRSEVFRRHLEAADGGVQTLGFAGFFAFPIDYTPLGHDDGGAQCPVLLTPSHRIKETTADRTAEPMAEQRRRLGHEVRRAWQSFKMGAISCFSFVGPIGLAYLPKLFTDGFGRTRPVPHPAEEGLACERDVELDVDAGASTGISLEDRIELAASALGAMSLTEGFARLVLITGHGSSTVNNPHATGLDCGACGGRTGEANARVAAAVLNDPAVRQGLAERDVHIPDDTVFLACQHDTTTDAVTIFNRSDIGASHRVDLERLERALEAAGRSCRSERAARLHLQPGQGTDSGVLARSRDWAQVRPEWGLAGCSAFIAAPRHRTASLDLAGRSFLHSYAWRRDEGFGVLELIMTAPMVVASWISLQYYASTVDNALFGSGNKTLHNVVGTVGVLEGNGGDLRVGLPWQSVHDGEEFQHEPVRLSVIIEAPIDAMNAIIEKHDMVRQLVDNRWLDLFAMDSEGKVTARYDRDLRWVPTSDPRATSAA